MRHDTKQGLIVIAIFFGPLLLILAVVFARGAHDEQRAALNSVADSMKRSLSDMLATSTNSGSPAFDTEHIRKSFCDAEHSWLKSTSFVEPDKIWIAANTVARSTTNLICVAEVFSGQFYGIDGTSNFTKLPPPSFASWPHVSARPHK